MDDDANTNISSHILIRDKETKQVMVNKRIIQPKKQQPKDVKNDQNKSNS